MDPTTWLGVDIVTNDLVPTATEAFLAWWLSALLFELVTLAHAKGANPPRRMVSPELPVNRVRMPLRAGLSRCHVMAPALDAFATIRYGVAGAQMIGIAAGRIIAAVQNVQTGRDVSLPELVGDAMRPQVDTAVAEISVAEFVPESLIDPASSERIDQTFRFEALSIVFIRKLLTPKASASLCHMLTVQLCDIRM